MLSRSLASANTSPNHTSYFFSIPKRSITHLFFSIFIAIPFFCFVFYFFTDLHSHELNGKLRAQIWCRF